MLNFLRSKKIQKGDQFFYQVSDFCKNCNHDSSYHTIAVALVNVWLIFDLQKYVNWLCVFSKVNPFFQKAQVFCMDLQPAADPYNVVCKLASIQQKIQSNFRFGYSTIYHTHEMIL